MVDDRDAYGRFKPRHTDEAVLEAVSAHAPAATSEVADDLGIARQSADYRLRRLEESGHVTKKKIGASLVWFLDTPPRDEIAASGLSTPGKPSARGADHPEEQGADDRPQEAGEPEPTPADAPATGVAVPIEIGALDLPGSGETLRRRREAVGACYLFLRKHGTAQKSAFAREVYGAGHEAGYQSAGGWWNAVGKQGLSGLAEQREEVVAPGGEGEHTWTFVESQ